MSSVFARHLCAKSFKITQSFSHLFDFFIFSVSYLLTVLLTVTNKIIYDDFLARDIYSDINSYEYDNIYFVANIPYYITTPIIQKLIETKITFKTITVMIQKEVADRFSAKTKTKDYGSITVFLNYYYDIEKLLFVSRNAFIPKPNSFNITLNL